MTQTLVRTQRIVALDTLRGFALCGILLVNIPWSIATISMPIGPGTGEIYPAARLLELLVQGRFFPIFSFLFGVSFALFLDSAKARTPHPRLILLRRLVALAVLGLAHQQLHPGEALLPYAIIGVVVLLPASWLPRWLVLAAALTITAAGLFTGGGLLLIPGLFLLGLTAVRFNVIDNPPRTELLLPLAVIALLAAITAQAMTTTLSYGETVAASAGLISAVAYSTILLSARTTRLGPLIDRTLAPMGRMALTNYVSATLLAIAGGALLDLHDSTHYGRMLALAAAILALQSWASQWWLARHRYGPLEALWRTITWWSRTPTRP